MSYGDNRLYLYENVLELVLGTDGIYVDNRPMNNRKLVAHKSLTNDLVFNIRNRDRKLQNVFSETLSAYLINPTTKRRLFYKTLEHTDTVGQVKLELNEGDLQNVDAGLYRIYIARQTADGKDKPVFSNQNSDLVFDIEVTEQIDQSPVPTQSANSFVQVADTGSGANANIFASSAFSGNQDRNFSHALHSIAIFPSNYSGNIDIQGSCIEGAPDNDDASTDWFTIVNDVNFSSSSNTYHKTFTVNANWLRILHTPDSDNAGNISLVQVRN